MTRLLPTRTTTSVWLCAAVVALAACGGDSQEREVRRAEDQVAAKEKALSEAKAEMTAAAAAFCQAGEGYILALDRYGDVLNATAPTVGDVREAGGDLATPREEVLTEAEAAVAAQQNLVQAEQELADARAALEAAKNGTPQPSEPSAATTATPLAPAATVNRVKQAESDFQSAQEGVTDQTPLVQASQQFNSAAVALEMSWLVLFADAGCLTEEQAEQAEAAVRDYTLALQDSLATAGYYEDEIDGVYGPATVDAVEALQKANGLPVTGTVDKATEAALKDDLQAKGGAAAQRAVASTAALQQTLKLAGFWDGPVDGEWTPELTEALKAFQTELGVEPTGAVDAATVAALEEAIASAKKPEAPPTPSPPTTEPRPTATTP